MYDEVKCFLRGEKHYTLSHEEYVGSEEKDGYRQTRLTFHHVSVINKPKLKAYKGEDVDTEPYNLVILMEDNARYTIYVEPMYCQPNSLMADSYMNLTKAQVQSALKKYTKSEIAVKILKEVD